MLINFSILHLIFVLNLIEKSYSVIRKVSKFQSSSKAPLKIVASDDEVLHPLFEKEEGDSSTIKPADSCQNSSRSSRNSKKEKKTTRLHTDEGSSFLKMNLDLPSIMTNFASTPSNAVVLNQKISFAFNSSTNYGSSTSLAKSEASIEKTQDQETIGNFNSPFGNEIAEDIDVVLFRKNVSNAIAPGMIISSSSTHAIPGTVISSSSSSAIPGTVIVDSSKIIASKPFTPPLDEKNNILIGFDSLTLEIENKIPCNVDLNNNKHPVPVLPPKGKRVKTLDEYSIEGLTFDNTPGPKIGLDSEITIDFISKTLIPFFKSGKVLDRKSSYSILYRAYQEFLEEETLHEIQLENDQKIIIFGDIHGQFPDFIKVIENEGPPSDKLKYIFNGDIVDRGAYSIECLMTLLAFKIADPNNFYVSLGNHETESVGKLQFYKESIKKYGSDEFFKLAHALFKSFPAAYLIQNEVFVTHGGISPFVTLDRIREIDRLEPDPEDNDIINDLIWSDPVNQNGTTSSHRGLGFLFGPDITHDFVHQNNISVIIRSHQFKEFGFSEQHDGLCITVFSCPNYKGKMKNYGAYIKIDDQLNLNYKIFKAAEPKAKTQYPIVPSDLNYSRNVRRIRK